MSGIKTAFTGLTRKSKKLGFLHVDACYILKLHILDVEWSQIISVQLYLTRTVAIGFATAAHTHKWSPVTRTPY